MEIGRSRHRSGGGGGVWNTVCCEIGNSPWHFPPQSLSFVICEMGMVKASWMDL